ncbi:Transcriptional adapter 1 [Sciurus carolinensis]|uniref:Transcriptional adapter 1 n=1 Tax=Sciurus carolinensis TaxID=30640 RepID=A0AA41NKA6_SCICA|nr:Transcriptional adapter 1 [Sciurus carolinensis]
MLDLCPGRGGGSTTKPGKPKVKKKLSFVRSLTRFQSQNPLSGAQQFVAKDSRMTMKLCSHMTMLPTCGQLEERMIMKAYEYGLDNVAADAISAMVYAMESHLKDILTSVVSRRKTHRLVAYNSLIEGPPATSAPCAGQNPAVHLILDAVEQQVALLLACPGDTLPVPLPQLNMYDLLEALQVHREVIPIHAVYAFNIERIIMKLLAPKSQGASARPSPTPVPGSQGGGFALLTGI